MLIRDEKLTLPGALFIMMVAGITLTHIFFQIAALFLLFYWFVEFRAGNSFHMSLLEKFIFLFFISGLIAVFLTENPLLNLPHLMPHIILLSIIPLNWRFSREGFPHYRMGYVLLFFTTVAALGGIYFHFQGLPRTHGFNGGYFTLASVMVFSIPLILGESMRQHAPLLRNGYFLLALLHLMALWWTFTRSAFLGFFLGIGLWVGMDLWKSYQQKNFTITSAFTVRLVLMLILLTFIFTARDPRINPLAKPSSTAQTQQQMDLTSGRASIYQDALHFLAEDWHKGHWVNLLFGHGLNSRNRMVQSPYTSWESDYLQAMMNQGLWGLLMVIAIYWLFIKQAFHALVSADIRIQATGAAAMGYWAMSFFTLKLTGFTDAALFVVLTVLLTQQSRLSNNQS